jgi:hypothetical protein
MPTLLGRLLNRSHPELTAVAERWSVALPGRNQAEDVATLYRTMTDTWALRDVLADLSPAAARLLWALARDGPPLAPPDAATLAAAEELTAAALLHHLDGEATSWPFQLADETGALCRRLADERRHGDRRRLPLPTLIATLDTADLNAAAEAWRLGPAGSGQPADRLVAALIEAIALPLALADLLTTLDRPARNVYELLQASERGLAIDLLRRHAQLPPAQFRRALRQLHTSLLVWEAWVDRERLLFVPSELRRSRPTTTSLTPVEGEPLAWHHPIALAWDLLAWLRASLTPSERPAAEPLPAGYPLWHAAQTERRLSYRRLLRAAASAAGLTEASTIDTWRQRSLAEQQANLVGHWLTSPTSWPDEAEPTSTRLDWPTHRTALLTVLRRLTPATWYPVEALADQAGRLIDGRSQRPGEASLRLLLSQLQGPLVWLGLLENGREPINRRPLSRVTAATAWLLGQAPPPADEPPALVVEPSLRILVYAVNAPLLWILLAAANPDRLDRVSLFQLSRASIETALALGLATDGIIAGLAGATRHPLPQNVVYSIDDWGRMARRARLSRALILTFDDAHARDDALNLPALRALGAEPLPGDRLALPVPDPAAEAAITATLQRLGFNR